MVEGGLIAESFTELAPALLQEGPGAFRRALPNVKRVFGEGGGYSALVGWGRLPEDYSKLSRLQVEGQFRRILEYSKRAIFPEGETSYRFDETTPFSGICLRRS